MWRLPCLNTYLRGHLHLSRPPVGMDHLLRSMARPPKNMERLLWNMENQLQNRKHLQRSMKHRAPQSKAHPLKSMELQIPLRSHHLPATEADQNM